MKTKLWLPCILLGFSLSSFSGSSTTVPQSSTQTASSREYCNIYAVTMLMKNGQPVTTDLSNYLFYFCSNNVFSIYSHAGNGEGTWMDDGKTIMISTSVPDPSVEWINGNWTVLERGEWTLVLERSEGGDTWRVTFEGRQR